MYSSWWPVISQRIEKTSNENYLWTWLFLFALLSVVSSLLRSKKVFWVNRNNGHKQLLGGGGGHGSPYRRHWWGITMRFLRNKSKISGVVLFFNSAQTNLNFVMRFLKVADVKKEKKPRWSNLAFFWTNIVCGNAVADPGGRDPPFPLKLKKYKKNL